MATPFLITIPKYISIAASKNANTNIPVRPAPSPSEYSVDEFLITNGEGSIESPAKKRRLDHLTWEEKFQRKKMKNRVAAQTSRDRKKARMDDMERTIQTITDENSILKDQFTSLTAENEELIIRNNELERQINELKIRAKESTVKRSMIDRSVGCDSLTLGSAVSNTIDPLPQGVNTQPMEQLYNIINHHSNATTNTNNNKKKTSNNNESIVLWKIIALCLLYRTCSTWTSTKHDSKNWPKICSPISSQTLQTMLQAAIKEMPKMKAPQSDCLDQWWGAQQKTWNPPKISMPA